MDTLHALCSAEERRIGPAYGLLLTRASGSAPVLLPPAMNFLRAAPGA